MLGQVNRETPGDGLSRLLQDRVAKDGDNTWPARAEKCGSLAFDPPPSVLQISKFAWTADTTVTLPRET